MIEPTVPKESLLDSMGPATDSIPPLQFSRALLDSMHCSIGVPIEHTMRRSNLYCC